MAYNAQLGYDPDKDYSAEIAKTTNQAQRDALLAERQLKLDAMNASGKDTSSFASNDTVSTWTDTYRPGGWDSASQSYRDSGGRVTSGSSGVSKGSSGSSGSPVAAGGGSSIFNPNYNYSDEDRALMQSNKAAANLINYAKEAWAKAYAEGNTAGMAQANALANQARERYGGYKGDTWGNYAGAAGQQGNAQMGLGELGLFGDYGQYYLAAAEAAKRAQEAATQAALKKYEAMIPGVQEQADADRGAAYAAGQLSSRLNAEQVAAMGLGRDIYSAPASGYSETSRIAEDMAMRNNIAAVTAAERADIREIESMMAQIQAEGLAAGAQIDADTAFQMAQAKMQAEQLEYERQQAALDRELQQKAMEAEQAQIRYSQAWDKLGSGIFSAEIAADAGISEEDARNYAKMAAAAMSLQTSAKRSSGGGSGGSSSSKPRLTLAQTKEEVENGNLAPEVVRAYAYYYGLDEETALAALEAATEQEKSPEEAARENYTTAVYNGAKAMRQSGRSSTEILRYLWDNVRGDEDAFAQLAYILGFENEADALSANGTFQRWEDEEDARAKGKQFDISKWPDR